MFALVFLFHFVLGVSSYLVSTAALVDPLANAVTVATSSSISSSSSISVPTTSSSSSFSSSSSKNVSRSSTSISSSSKFTSSSSSMSSSSVSISSLMSSVSSSRRSSSAASSRAASSSASTSPSSASAKSSSAFPSSQVQPTYAPINNAVVFATAANVRPVYTTGLPSSGSSLSSSVAQSSAKHATDQTAVVFATTPAGRPVYTTALPSSSIRKSSAVLNPLSIDFATMSASSSLSSFTTSSKASSVKSSSTSAAAALRPIFATTNKASSSSTTLSSSSTPKIAFHTDLPTSSQASSSSSAASSRQALSSAAASGSGSGSRPSSLASFVASSAARSSGSPVSLRPSSSGLQSMSNGQPSSAPSSMISSAILPSSGSSAKSASSSARSSASMSVLASKSASAASSSARSSAAATASGLPGSILYSNPRCLYDISSARTLNSASYYQGSSSNSLEACALYCFQKGFAYAGAEYSTECYCGSSLTSTKTSTACTMPCSGNSSEICGGSNALTVIDVNLNYNTLDPNAKNGYQGCFVDGALLNATFRSGSMTIEVCNNYCSGIGYAYAGTEYGTNCFCGALGSVPQNLAPATACYASCYGNSAEACGGNGLMSIYKNAVNVSSVTPYTDGGKTTSSAGDIFAALPPNAPLAVFPQQPHNILPIGVSGTGPIHTNKQYAQAFYNSRQQILTMIPYIINWLGTAFAVQHSDANQYTVSGTATNGVGASSYGGPLAQAQMTFSAIELLSGQAVNMTADSSLHASVNLNMYPLASPDTKIVMPLVNGMGLVTARYSNLIPVLQSLNVQISSFSYVPAPTHSGISQKMRFQLSDSSVWVMYLIPNAGSSQNLVFTRNTTNTKNIVADSAWSGTFQTAKIPTASDPVAGEAALDQAAGTWVTSMKLSGSTSGSSGTYSFNYVKAGDISKSPLVFALPHHLEIISNGGATGIKMQSPITGVAQGYITDVLTMSEPDLPTDVGFIATSNPNWSDASILAIRKAITPDIMSGSASGCNQYSIYSSGKCLAKWGQLCMIAKDIVKDAALAQVCAASFRSVYNAFTSNTQNGVLVYETSWKGLVAASGFTSDGADYGATDYNDHHFHYGYVIYGAAVMGYLDPTFLTSANVEWVNTLVRDVANPSEVDPFFPQFRNMDWYIGHGVAHGIKDDEASGKDQESSSEDYNFSYGLKLWGHVTGNANLEGLGNVMCAVNMRSMNNYILLGPDNTNVPLSYALNYANGVTYANSMGYFTYFGAQPQYVNGIHMIPLTAISPYVRKPKFVQGEWDSLLEPLASSIEGTGWAGILQSDLAISDAQSSWEYFNTGSIVNFNYYNLDDGQSLSWALTFAAGLGGGAGN